MAARRIPIDMDVATHLRERRQKLGLTLGELARWADVPVVMVQRYETGWAGVPDERRRALEEALARRERERNK